MSGAPVQRTRRPLRLALLVATTASFALGLASPVSLGGAAASPAECVLLGIDDRCEKWAHRYTESEGAGTSLRHTSDYAVAGTVTRSGEIAFTLGHRTAWPRTILNEMQTVAYNVVTGDVLWARHEAAPHENWHAFARTIEVSADDEVVYAIGVVFRDPGSVADPRDILVAAYDAASGQRLWRKIYDGPGGIQDDAFAAAVAPVGDRLYVAAAVGARKDPVFTYGSTELYTARRIQTGGLEVDLDFALLTYDGTSGDLLDQTVHAGTNFKVDGVPHGSWDVPTDMHVSEDGRRIVVAGMTSSREAYRELRPHATVVVWDAKDGNPAGWTPTWTREVPGVPLGSGLMEGQETVVLSGVFGQGGTENNPYAVAGFDAADGSIRWETRFSLLGLTNRLEFPRALLMDEKRGTVYLPGLSRYTSSSVGAAGVLSLRASDGGVVWRETLRDPRSEATIIFNYDADEMPVGAVDPFSGHVQLASQREGRVVTFSLDRASGTQRWVGSFDHPVRQGYTTLEQSGVDWPVDIAAAAGRTVVFGSSYIPYRDMCGSGLSTRPCSQDDFLTIVYEV